jgi:hypothetical protein
VAAGLERKHVSHEQSVSSLNGTHLGRAKLHVTSFQRKNKRGEWGLMYLQNHFSLFILSKLAERMGFYYRRYLQVPMNATLLA